MLFNPNEVSLATFQEYSVLDVEMLLHLGSEAVLLVLADFVP